MLILSLVTSLSLARRPCQAPNEQLIETADQAAICLHHYPGAGEPVLLVHGIASNAAFWDVSDSLSVAKELQTAGFDVWTLDERGHGEAKRTLANRRQRYGWRIDDYGFYDIDAAIRHIQSTGHPTVHYVGHSLGGMALAPYLYKHGSSAIESMTILGSPMDFQHPDLLWQLSNQVAILAPPQIPTHQLAWMGSLLPQTPFAIDDFLFAENTMSPIERRQMYQRVVSPLTRQEVLQLYHAMKAGVFSSSDGTDYRKVLQETDVRALVIAGRGDYVASSDRVYGYYEALGAQHKYWLVLGKDYGFHHDYGHLDMVLSQSAFEDLLPVLIRWLSHSDIPNASPSAP